ncbi:MAG TPA: GNAT family N-acetyltransferase [Acidimicrobiia bacterium]|nr:GNAT family N-acetyltransferase [Acidimicrobiia bacterium]
MTYSYSLRSLVDLDEAQRTGIKALKEAVYPPEQYADDPVRSREWRTTQWCVLATDGEDTVASYTGMVIVEGEVDDEPVRIGGVGGIATHPDHRGRGLARNSIDIALEHMTENGADFALLVCRDQLVPYYESLGWRLFAGTTMNRQWGEAEVFTFNRVMVIDAAGRSPEDGIIDVAGPLW